MPKLFSITYLNDCDHETYLTVGESKEEVEERETKKLEEELNCFMGCTAYEVSEVNGYRVKLTEKGLFDDINPQDLTSICLKCGIDLGKCICTEIDNKNKPFFRGYKPNYYFNV